MPRYSPVPCRPTAMTLLYLVGVFGLVSLHSLRGCDGPGLAAALRGWYVVLPSAVTLLALRYASQFPSVSEWLQQTVGQDVVRDLGLSRAPSQSDRANDVFWNLIGDAVVVAFLAAQPQRLASASRARAGWRVNGVPFFISWWHDVINTFGDAILQVVLFLAVDRRQSVIGLGYLSFTVLFLMRPDLIQRLWMLPQWYAQSVCVLQTAMGLGSVRNWIRSFNDDCPEYLCSSNSPLTTSAAPQASPHVGSCECWLLWVGLDTMQTQTEPLSLFNLLSADLVVVLSSALVIGRRCAYAGADASQLRNGTHPSMRERGGEAGQAASTHAGGTRQRIFTLLRSVPLYVR